MITFFYAYSTVFYLLINFMIVCFFFFWLFSFANSFFLVGGNPFFMFFLGITFLFLFTKQMELLGNIDFLFEYKRLLSLTH